MRVIIIQRADKRHGGCLLGQHKWSIFARATLLARRLRAAMCYTGRRLGQCDEGTGDAAQRHYHENLLFSQRARLAFSLLEVMLSSYTVGSPFSRLSPPLHRDYFTHIMIISFHAALRAMTQFSHAIFAQQLIFYFAFAMPARKSFPPYKE